MSDEPAAYPAGPEGPGGYGGNRGGPFGGVPRRRRTRRWSAIVRLAVAALSLVVLVGSGLAWAAYKNFTADIPHGASVPPLAAGQKDADGKDQNILLMGNDSRAGASAAELKALSTGNDGGSENTDTMMVLHVPADGSRATVISFPRDSWVDIPGNGKGKLNSAYGDGYAAAAGRAPGRDRRRERRHHHGHQDDRAA